MITYSRKLRTFAALTFILSLVYGAAGIMIGGTGLIYLVAAVISLVYSLAVLSAAYGDAHIPVSFRDIAMVAMVSGIAVGIATLSPVTLIGIAQSVLIFCEYRFIRKMHRC